MASKKQILSNLREYSAEDLAQAISDGTITIYELSKTGQLTPRMRKRIGECLDRIKNGSPATPAEPQDVVTFEAPMPQEPIVQEPIAQTPVYTPSPEPVEVAQPNGHGGIIDIAPDEPIIPEVPVAPAAPPRPATKPEPQQQSYGAPNMGASTLGLPKSKAMFQAPFSFHGRIRRMEFVLTLLVYYVWMILLYTIPLVVYTLTYNEVLTTVAAIVLVIIGMVILWTIYAQGAKRCHDLGHSGWFQLIPFYYLIMLFADGQMWENKYGPSPKYGNLNNIFTK